MLSCLRQHDGPLCTFKIRELQKPLETRKATVREPLEVNQVGRGHDWGKVGKQASKVKPFSADVVAYCFLCYLTRL